MISLKMGPAELNCSHSIGMSLDPEKQFECRECGAKDLDDSTRRVFGIYVCKKCMRELPDKYSLLTKTEAKEVSVMPVPMNVQTAKQMHRCALLRTTS